MVKKLNAEDFINQLDGFYNASKDKYSVYLTFKRSKYKKFKCFIYYKVFIENNKFKKSKNKERREDRLKQVRDRYDVLVRAKLRKQRIQTIVRLIFDNSLVK